MPPRLSGRSRRHPSDPATSAVTRSTLGGRWRRARRAVLVRRRSLAAVLAAAAVLVGVRAAAAPPPPTTAVVVARTDLAGGTTLTDADLEVRRLPPGAAPAGVTGAAADLAGRQLAAPVRRGEPVTDVRLVAPGLLDGYPGRVAVPVRVADAAAVRLLHVGDGVDLVATEPDGGGSRTVAAAVPVVAVPPPAEGAEQMAGGGVVVVAVEPGAAVALVGASVTSVLSVVLTRR